MRAIVFLGPTLAMHEAAALLDADYRPPAAQGDVYRAAIERPFAIGLVDGQFHSVPAVWHKEILFALGEGIRVFGSASMGALRAAELADFGMCGVGEIFESYRSGRLEDDDEVALIHGPAELGYPALSEALVNIRATLHAAQAQGVLTEAQVRQLLLIAKALFYPHRSYERILDQAAEQGPAGSLAPFLAWLPTGRVDQKRTDAIALLARIREALGATDEGLPRRHDPPLESLGLTYLRVETAAFGRHGTEDQRVLAALRADPLSAERTEVAALGWLLAQQVAREPGRAAEAIDLLAASRAFCARHGLRDEDEVVRWLEGQGLSRGELQALLLAHAQVERAKLHDRARFDQALVDFLRWTGDYGTLAGKL